MNKVMLEKYAYLIVKAGVNLQKGQLLVIRSSVDCACFTREIAQIAYREGAKDVIIDWRDDLFSRIRYLHAPEEVFSEFPEWKREFFVSYARQGAAFLSIDDEDPEVMKGVDPERMTKDSKTRQAAIKEYRDRLMSNKNSWCVVAVPSVSWAMKVFPSVSGDEAVEKLWEEIFKTVRADTEDPAAAWEEHKNKLKRSIAFLSSNNFKLLHFRNSLGTDLKIELPEGHLWLGASDYTVEGVEFIANMPTEEVFTSPERSGVNGRVVSTKPLSYNGNIIDKFSLTFKDGRIVEYTAEKGYDTLKSIVDIDEGSHYLGEVALVPYDSPISKSGILFYNSLYDENASCHLAIGKSYSPCIKNGENMTDEELERAGLNESFTHVDFMIGSEDLDITGITADGKEVPVFRNGNFAF
ncbi:MAG TPA: aminopeptidase [Clostridia bacterium]|nr:aminopeptidase [Clostridia bacterium]